MNFNSFLERVGRNIQKARWLKKMTQEDVASKGVSYRYYQEIERGVRNPTLDMLFTIGSALGVSVEQLVDVEPKRNKVRLVEAKAEQPRRGRRPGMRKTRLG